MFYPGERQSKILVINFRGALKLVMMLGGKRAAMYRTVMSDIIRRHYAGDLSLIPELQANAASDAPIAQLARESLVNDPVGEPAEGLEDQPQPKKRVFESGESGMSELEVLERKQKLNMSWLEVKNSLEFEFMTRKQRLDLESAEHKHRLELESFERKQKLDMERQALELEQTERKQKLELEAIERKQQLAERQKIFLLDSADREMGTQAKILETYSTLCPGGQLADDKGREVFKGNFLRISGQTALPVEVKAEPVLAEGEEPDDGSTIGEMLTAMGHAFDANDTRMIGIRVIGEYKKVWGIAPVQRQLVTNGVRRVASIYGHGDCELIGKVVAEYLAGKA